MLNQLQILSLMNNWFYQCEQEGARLSHQEAQRECHQKVISDNQEA